MAGNRSWKVVGRARRLVLVGLAAGVVAGGMVAGGGLAGAGAFHRTARLHGALGRQPRVLADLLRHREAALRARRVKNRLRELRAERGWSQVELGTRVGVSRQAIIAIETGRFAPSLPLAFKLARVFGCSIEQIFQPEER